MNFLWFCLLADAVAKMAQVLGSVSSNAALTFDRNSKLASSGVVETTQTVEFGESLGRNLIGLRQSL